MRFLFGDIISYKYGDNIITHRIEEITETAQGKEYVTKGDNNNSADSEKVEFKNIEGKYIKKIGYAGKILIFLKSRTAILIVLILILILYNHEIKTNRKLKARNRKRKRYNYETRKALKSSNNNERKSQE